MKDLTSKRSVVICTDHIGYEASLEQKKLYEALPDADAAKHNQARIIDESGEDYLYPMSYFTRVTLPDDILRQLFDAA